MACHVASSEASAPGLDMNSVRAAVPASLRYRNEHRDSR